LLYIFKLHARLITSDHFTQSNNNQVANQIETSHFVAVF